MIRLLRAFAWLRWRLMVNSFRASGRRDSLERVSRVLSVILPVVLTIMFVPAALGGAVVAAMGGYGVGSGRIDAATVIVVLRIVLAIFTVGLVLAPAIRSARGGSTGLARFMTLPIPVGFLYLSDAVLALFDPWFMILIPVLVMFPLGLAASGRLGFAATALAAGLLFLVLLLAMETTISNVLNLLYRNRRRGETATVVILFLLSMLGSGPLLVHWLFDAHASQRPAAHEAPADRPDERGSDGSSREPSGDRHGREADSSGAAKTQSDPSGRSGFQLGPGGAWAVTAPIQILPSEIYGRALLRAQGGRLGAAALQVGLLAAIAAALAGISWTTYRRLLSTPDISGRFGKGARSRTLALKLPLLSEASSAVAVATAKVVLRSVTGKMAVWFSPVSMVVLMIVLTRLGRADSGLAKAGIYLGPAAAAVGGFFCLITMQRFMLNQYAIDGAGATLQLLAPLSGRSMVAGKIVGLGLLFAVPCTVYTLASLAFLPRAPVLLWAAAIVSVFGMYVLYAPATSILAALFPRTADLSRMGKSSNPSTPAGLSGLALSGLCFLPFAALNALVLGVWRSPLLALVVSALAAGAALLVTIKLVVAAAGRVFDSRRENLAMVAQGR